MNENDFGKLNKIGNWISAILLGNTRELIARIDERTLLILADVKDLKADVKDMKKKLGDTTPKVDLLWKERCGSLPR